MQVPIIVCSVLPLAIVPEASGRVGAVVGVATWQVFVVLTCSSNLAIRCAFSYRLSWLGRLAVLDELCRSTPQGEGVGDAEGEGRGCMVWPGAVTDRPRVVRGAFVVGDAVDVRAGPENEELGVVADVVGVGVAGAVKAGAVGDTVGREPTPGVPAGTAGEPCRTGAGGRAASPFGELGRVG